MPDTVTQSAAKDNILDAVTVEVTVSVGRARPTMGELANLHTDAVLSLDTAIEDPVELYIGNRLIAVGVLEDVSTPESAGIGVRITQLLDQKTSGS